MEPATCVCRKTEEHKLTIALPPATDITGNK
jgi:hypothetical protein